MLCAGCGKTFTPRRANHKYCSTTCRVVWFQRKPEHDRRERDALLRLKLQEVLTTQNPELVRQQITEALDLLQEP